MLCFKVCETTDHILSGQILCIFFLIIWSQKANCIFCGFSLFNDGLEFSTLFPNFWKVMSNICFVSMCLKRLILFYLHRYYVHLLDLISLKKSYYEFCWSSVFDNWLKFSTYFQILDKLCPIYALFQRMWNNWSDFIYTESLDIYSTRFITKFLLCFLLVFSIWWLVWILNLDSKC
jgi:hypothetical protein